MADTDLKSNLSVSQRFMICDAAMRECDIKTAHNRGKYERPIPVPYIRLMGKWLAQAGFKPRSRVCVQVEDGRLIITPA
ncbi:MULTISPECIES: SymE family type I addiction module toxin [unclassified Caballeronia]|jgi:toxic protein SymE|uniref:SymE family type I addiction module toxin n=1 Tax=unclassified Caballeronia TaxID=2646786 RepID=UPI002028B68D|nr:MULTISPECIES: SymE family type I addiction module toxin [unclassified Caballeronia]MDR5767963.1 SymE family type I addiction module toxin [Caballeronia sp. LZ028]